MITNQGQMTLATPQGQVQIVFSGDLIEARYPDGRIERVNLNQWVSPCAGVTQRVSFPNSAPHTIARSAFAKIDS
jgi:proline racemase